MNVDIVFYYNVIMLYIINAIGNLGSKDQIYLQS